jgi:hypothetical protein
VLCPARSLANSIRMSGEKRGFDIRVLFSYSIFLPASSNGGSH